MKGLLIKRYVKENIHYDCVHVKNDEDDFHSNEDDDDDVNEKIKNAYDEKKKTLIHYFKNALFYEKFFLHHMSLIVKNFPLYLNIIGTWVLY